MRVESGQQHRSRTMSPSLWRWLGLACAVALCRFGVADAANSIADAKKVANGSYIYLSGKVVSGRLWGDRFYIVEPDRSCGIGVLKSTSLNPGQVVTVAGFKTTQHGEPYIGVASVTVTSSTSAPRPVGLTSASMQTQPFATGLPVKVWGQVTAGMQSDSLGSYFTLSDGGASLTRVYVGNTGAQAPGIGVTATAKGIGGINGTEAVVLLGSSTDISTYSGFVDYTIVPEWVWNAGGIARVALDLNAVTAACADGADVVEVPVQDIWYSFYPSTVATSGGTYGNGVLLQQIIGYAHSQGVKVIGAMPACKDASCLTAHTDWRQRPTDSTTWLTKPADQVTGCLVSPYGDYLINEIAELARSIGLDGVSLQGYSNTQAFCYCTYCKSAYQAEMGASIPASINYDDANFRRYLAWHDAKIVDHLTRLQQRAKLIRPGFGVFSWSENAGKYGHYFASPATMPTSLNSLFDCAMQYVQYDEANMGLSVIPEFGLRYMSALTHHRPWISEADYTTRGADATIGVPASSLPEAEVQFRMLSAIASGAITSFSSAEKQYMRASLFSVSRARTPWTAHSQPMKWAAMVVSETTRQLYGRSDAVNKYMQSCFGFFRMMVEQHLPVDILTEGDLEAGMASGYKVLILPNTACLSSASLAAVRSFVAAGGGLVATGAASLYDDQGAARADYALSDLFGVSKAGSPVSLETKVTVDGPVFVRNRSALEKMLSPYGHITSYVGSLYPVTLLSGASSMASICSDLACTISYPLYVNNTPSGGGRVAYFPAAIDSAYYRYSYPYEGVLLKDAVTWAASAPPAVRVVGPKTLHASFFAQNSGKRLVIHLLNTTNTRGAHANPAGDVPARDEVAPLYDIEVWFESTTPSSVTLQPEDLTLVPSYIGGRARVIVSELQQHSMVVADVP